MPIYLYCLLPANSDDMAAADATPCLDGAGVALRGVGGAAVRAMPVSGMVAWVSDIATTGAIGATGPSDHARVVTDALRLRATPLAARRGQVFSSDESLRAEIASRRESLMGALTRLRGMVEMILHVHMPPAAEQKGLRPAGADTGGGRAYLERLRSRVALDAQEQVDGERMRLQALEALSGLVHSDALSVVRGARRCLVSHLVRQAEVEAWRMRARSLMLEGARIRVVGPFPPYSFAAVDDSRSAAHGQV